jgi:hypothetical protein
MLDQFLFGLNDKEVQLKLFDIGPTLTIDQAISTARTCETSKLLAEQLTSGASVQGIKPKSTYQKQKSAKVTTAAAAATKADTPTKPLATSVASKFAPRATIAQPETQRVGNAMRLGISKLSATPKPRWQPSLLTKCHPPKTTPSPSQSRPEEKQPQK